jgi:glycosyltransferase involved in cell wall biosynthesis
MQLVFWHNIISPHQAPFMRCLADAGHDVLVVATETMSEDRLRLGWAVPSLGSARLVVNPSPSQVRDIVCDSSPDSVHFIAGARGTPLGAQVAKACRKYKRRAGIITEAPDMRGLGGVARWVKYWNERRRVGNQFDFLLAMGEKGIRWFRRFGYPSDRFFPFAYVTESVIAVDPSAGEQGMCKLLYVGQMIHRKGVDVLLRALAQVPRCELALIGSGPELSALQALAEQLGVDQRVSWMGQMHAEKIPEAITNSDVFILPSREDGWGAVVNESIMVGTPVICSDACGAAELIRQEWLGGVFRSGSVEELAALLEEWVGRVESGTGEREHIRAWSKCIEGAAVAAYVEEILEHVYLAGPRPVAPWRKDNP